MESEIEIACAQPFVPDRWLKDGDSVCFENISLKVFHCPGHTPGHVVFYQKEAKLAIVGDVLFQGSIGRTDFPSSPLRHVPEIGMAQFGQFDPVLALDFQ